MESNIVLSIIIPVYNVKCYLTECIDSILSQLEADTKRRIEIIIINDGSTDGSERILNNYGCIKGLKIFHQENHGLSYSRNRGLKEAVGKYVWFIDSDDFIHSNALSELFPILNSEIEYDVVSIVTSFLKNGKLKTIPKGNLKTGIFSYKEWFLKGYVYPYSGAPFYIFLRAFLVKNKFLFKEGIYFEDLLFTPTVMCKANKRLHIAKALYVYRLREGSITNTDISIKKWLDMLSISDEFYKLRQNTDRLVQHIFNSNIAMVVGALGNYYDKLKKEDRKIALSEFNTRNYWLQSIIYSYRKKYIVRYLKLKLKSIIGGF